VKVHHWNSFPSGHTLTAYSLAVILPLIFPSMRRWQAAVVLASALLCGFSRIILVQHWPQDVLGGMLLGCSAAFLAVCLIERLPSKAWLEKPLMFHFRR
jgi:membrane-associated phospholipid phosphatase